MGRLQDNSFLSKDRDFGGPWDSFRFLKFFRVNGMCRVPDDCACKIGWEGCRMIPSLPKIRIFRGSLGFLQVP